MLTRTTSRRHDGRHRLINNTLLARQTTTCACVLLLLCVLLASAVHAFRPTSLPRPTKRDYARITTNLDKVTGIVDVKSTVDFHDSSSILSKILIPRVPDTPANADVRQTLLSPFRNSKKWTIEEHKFIASTPQGEKKMTNLIVTYNIHAPRKLVLAAHHDSKVSPKGFIGATDSAVPCAIMVDAAMAFEKLLDQQQGKASSNTEQDRMQEIGLQLIFFDGEEAYVQWTRSDSVYGSRALASQWATSFFSPQLLGKRRTTPGYATMRFIDSIDQFVLLDLLGTPSPRIPSYYESTRWMHDELRSIEQRLASIGLLYPKDATGSELQYPPKGGYGTTQLPSAPGTDKHGTSFFTTSGAMSGIDDDHRPFLENGVPILHVIPSPFPSVWHTMADNTASLDWPTVYAWSMIMRVFVAEYFEIDVSFSSSMHAAASSRLGKNDKEMQTGRNVDEFVSGDGDEWQSRATLAMSKREFRAPL